MLNEQRNDGVDCGGVLQRALDGLVGIADYVGGCDDGQVHWCHSVLLQTDH